MRSLGTQMDASTWFPNRTGLTLISAQTATRFIEPLEMQTGKRRLRSWIAVLFVAFLLWYPDKSALGQADPNSNSDLAPATVAENAAQAKTAEVNATVDSTTDQNDSEAKDAVEAKEGFWIQLRFPLTEADDRNLRTRLQEISDKSAGLQRPIVVIEFIGRNNLQSGPIENAAISEPIGRATEFEKSLALARFLVGQIAIRCRTIAYSATDVEGHAVLVALACEEIALSPKATLGRISLDEGVVDSVVHDSYLAISRRRQTIPDDAVSAMIDRQEGLFRVETNDDKIEFLSRKRTDDLREKGVIRSEDQLSIEGQLGNFSGQSMRNWLWIRQTVQDVQDFKDSFRVDRWSLGGDSLISGPRKPGVVEFHGVVTEAAINRWIRSIDELLRSNEVNLLFVDIQTPGGDLAQSLRLAQYLAGLDESKVETVAWVNEQALGDGVLIAMSCDQMYLTPNAKLGGPGEASISNDDIESYAGNWEELAKQVLRTPGEIYALLCPTLPINEFENEAGRKEVGTESLFFANNAHPKWKMNAPIKIDNGMVAEEVVRRRWARGLEKSLLDIAAKWNLNELPEPKRISSIEQFVQRLGSQEWLATFLLIASFSFITKEFAAPGMGLPGFLALICFSLFFWMKFLDGTVEWLEMILIGVGLLSIAFEVFVLPGFGIFGFGGLILVISGIVLASQTFIVPTNEYQWRSTAWHTSQVAVAFLSVFAMLFWMKDHLEQLPFFRWLKLEPPVSESIVSQEFEDLSLFVGSIGITTTKCTPYGKAKVEGRYFDVHSQDGLLGTDTAVKVIAINGKSMDVVQAEQA